MLAFFLLLNIMIFGAFIALLKGSEPPVEFGSNLNESEFINTTVQVGEEKSGFTYVSTRVANVVADHDDLLTQ